MLKQRLYLWILVVVMGIVPGIGGNAVAGSPKYEMRGAWLVTVYGLDWPSTQGVTRVVVKQQQEQLDSLLTNLRRAGINAVFFQVRPMADALYNSSYEPWSSYLTGTRGKAATYDPLKWCIERCHTLGMECHAWINPFRVGTREPGTSLDLRKKHLWMTNRVGRVTMTIFNPAYDDTRELLCNICREIATDYDVDGIVFDDYFYNPEFIPEDERASDWECYIAAAENGLSIGDWRRDNINRTIAEVYATISSVKEGKIRFGVSPQGIAGGNGVYEYDGVPKLAEYGVLTGDSQYSKIYSDPVNWLKEGIVDYISPQIYWGTDNPRHPYGGLSRWWNDVAEMYGRHCYPSLTITAFEKDNTPEKWEETFRQVELNRQSSFNYAPGTVFYSARFIAGGNGQKFGKELRKEKFGSMALVPSMKWKTGVKAMDIKGLTLGNGGQLKWEACDDARYVVYAIPDDVSDSEAPAGDYDGINPEYMIAVTYESSYTLPVNYRKGYRIAVAPYDRYGVEWQPIFL